MGSTQLVRQWENTKASQKQSHFKKGNGNPEQNENKQIMHNKKINQFITSISYFLLEGIAIIKSIDMLQIIRPEVVS